MELARIFAPVASEMEDVDRRLRELLRQVARESQVRGNGPGIVSGIVQYPFAVPGKRIRPALVLLTARMVGGPVDSESLVTVASAVEILHAASLVHDDIIDGADARRNQISLNKRFGNRVAVLAGDILYTHFFSLVTGLAGVDPGRRFALLDLFLETTKAMCAGEILAQEVGARRPLAYEDYREIASDKTAVLFSACCRSAAILCDTDGRSGALGEFGLTFGLTFQMADDLVDGDHGLPPGYDLRARTVEHASRARACLQSFPAGVYRESLSALIDYVVDHAVS